MSEKNFDHQIAFITARINIAAPHGAGVSVGTGFFFATPLNDGTDQSLVFLVSNKHVFIDPKGKMILSFNHKKEDGSPEFGNIKTFVDDNFENAYFAHPDSEIDLACVNVSAIANTDSFYKHITSEFLKPIDYEKIAPGSSVIFVGYPENRYDVVNNLPLVRRGSIASVPDVDFNGKGQLVIDAQVFQGSSGSPVFVAANGSYNLLGVVSETMIRHSKLQTLPSNMPEVGVQQILGLGIVVKQKHVQELIDFSVSEFIRRKENP